MTSKTYPCPHCGKLIAVAVEVTVAKVPVLIEDEDRNFGHGKWGLVCSDYEKARRRIAARTDLLDQDFVLLPFYGTVGTRIVNVLRADNLNTVREVVQQRSARELLRTPNFGYKCLAALTDSMNEECDAVEKGTLEEDHLSQHPH